MKRLSIIIIILFALISCKKDNFFVIKGKVLNRESGIVRLSQIGEFAFDAKVCSLKNGHFFFDGEIDLPEEFFISFKENENSKETNYYKFFVEPDSRIKIVFNVENINKSIFKGSKIGNEYYKIRQEIYNKFSSKIERLIPEYEIAQNDGDNEQLNEVVNKIDSISGQLQKWEMDYIGEHPNSYLSANLLYQRQFNLSLDTLQKYFEKLDKSLNESKYYKRINSYLSVQVGNPFVDFELQDQTGNIHKLSSIAKNKVVLIDFWASYCHPCREHNKHLKKLYEANKSKGFEIVGVSIDRDTTQFIQTIVEDEMTWLNLMDRTGEDPVRKIYETSNVPFNVLIDSNGIIAYRANDYENLEIMVNNLLNKK